MTACVRACACTSAYTRLCVFLTPPHQPVADWGVSDKSDTMRLTPGTSGGGVLLLVLWACPHSP